MEKLFPDPFIKNKNWMNLWINNLRFYTVFYCMPSLGLLKNIKTKIQSTFFYLILSFIKNEKRSGTSLPTSFSA